MSCNLTLVMSTVDFSCNTYPGTGQPMFLHENSTGMSKNNRDCRRQIEIYHDLTLNGIDSTRFQCPLAQHRVVQTWSDRLTHKIHPSSLIQPYFGRICKMSSNRKMTFRTLPSKNGLICRQRCEYLHYNTNCSPPYKMHNLRCRSTQRFQSNRLYKTPNIPIANTFGRTWFGVHIDHTSWRCDEVLTNSELISIDQDRHRWIDSEL